MDWLVYENYIDDNMRIWVPFSGKPNLQRNLFGEYPPQIVVCSDLNHLPLSVLSHAVIVYTSDGNLRLFADNGLPSVYRRKALPGSMLEEHCLKVLNFIEKNGFSRFVLS